MKLTDECNACYSEFLQKRIGISQKGEHRSVDANSEKSKTFLRFEGNMHYIKKLEGSINCACSSPNIYIRSAPSWEGSFSFLHHAKILLQEVVRSTSLFFKLSSNDDLLLRCWAGFEVCFLFAVARTLHIIQQGGQPFFSKRTLKSSEMCCRQEISSTVALAPTFLWIFEVSSPNIVI